LKAGGQAAQRGAEGGGAAIEVEFAEIACGVETGIEGETAELELIGDGFLPAGLVIEEALEEGAAGLGFATVGDLEALAVVGDDGEEVCAGACSLGGPEGFEQTKCERADADDLEGSAEPAEAAGGGGPIAPEHKDDREGQREGARQQPVLARKYKGGEAHLSFPNCS
jgi:hypothetical protein